MSILQSSLGVLWRPLGAAIVSSAWAGPTPLNVPTGLLGHWDASTLGHVLDTSGAPAILGVNVGSVVNRASSGLGNLSTSSSYNAGFPWLPRLVGNEGGLAPTLPDASYWGPYSPVVDFTAAYNTPAITMGSAVARAVYLVWSRPQLPYQRGQSSYAVNNVIQHGGTAIIQITNNGQGTDTLTLFPGTSSATVIASNVPHRFTHSLLVVFNSGGTVDVWFDDSQVSTAIANPMAASASAAITFSQQAYFHEAAVWDHALSSAELTTLLTASPSASKRWGRGARYCPLIIPVGQSNATRLASNTYDVFQETVRFSMGALGVDLNAGKQNRFIPLPSTLNGGTPLYHSALAGIGYLNNTGGGATSTWTLDTPGQWLHDFCVGLTTDDKARVAGVWSYFTEADSGRTYSEKTVYKSAWQELLLRMRTWLGVSNVPMFTVNVLPYGNPTVYAPTTQGHQMIRESFAELAADPNNYFNVVMPNSSGVDDDGTGDGVHFSTASYQQVGRLAGLRIATLVARSDPGNVLITGLPTLGGPFISAAHVENSTSILLTITHDAGNDIRLPVSNPTAGWSVLDGYTGATSPGTSLGVSAVVRVDATHIRLTLTTAIVGATAGVRVFTIFGNPKVGISGTPNDNYSTTATGQLLGSQLGTPWPVDMPLAVPVNGITPS